MQGSYQGIALAMPEVSKSNPLQRPNIDSRLWLIRAAHFLLQTDTGIYLASIPPMVMR